MKHIELIKEFDLTGQVDSGKDKDVTQLFNGSRRGLVEIWLKNNAVLARHKADVPITVFCLSGKGVFRAGRDLEDEQDLRAGTLLTLEAGVEHEVIADPTVQIIVTKFKDS